MKPPAPIVVQSGAAPSAPGELIVHVTGAVRNPGVVTLAPEQRVQDAIAKAGATAVIQPGGSVKDEEVVAAADEHGLAMVFTGVRHFRH